MRTEDACLCDSSKKSYKKMESYALIMISGHAVDLPQIMTFLECLHQAQVLGGCITTSNSL